MTFIILYEKNIEYFHIDRYISLLFKKKERKQKKKNTESTQDVFWNEKTKQKKHKSEYLFFVLFLLIFILPKNVDYRVN